MKPPFTSRIESIDLLRGIVIVFMALDHVRDYFHADAFLFDPTDVSKTSAALFFTRWITHFCAPVFVFLAGTSAFQIGIKKGKKELSLFLLKRGVWLIVLELTVINIAWFFNFHFTFFALTVIWALGIGMITLAGIIYMPINWIGGVSALLILAHNAFDSVHVAGQTSLSVLWSLIHDQRMFAMGEGRNLFVGYALIPWVPLMALGYCFGSLYAPAFDSEKRKKILLQLGSIAVLVFFILRWSNLYGDPNLWSTQSYWLLAVVSFFNVTKYPASLLYLLMTLGPALLLLAFTEHVSGKISGALIVVGRVPLFFYVIHIYVVHLLALGAAILTGFPASAMVFGTWITNSPHLKGYGFSLLVVYLIWILIVAGLYPLCKMFDSYKQTNKNRWWLSYL